MALVANIRDRIKQAFRDDGYGSDGLPTTSIAIVPGSGSGGSSSSNVFTTGGVTAVSTGTITRPSDTTAYASGDLVANSTSAGSVVAFTIAGAARTGGPGSFILRRVRLRKTTATLTNASFRVYLFNSIPTVTVGDNAAFNVAGLLASNNVLGYLGSVDITADTAFSDGSKGFSGATFVDMQVNLGAGVTTMYALLEARAAYAPGNAEQFMVSVETLQD